MTSPLIERDLKRSRAALLVLTLVEPAHRHGYDIGKLIEERSDGSIRFQMPSLYPLLYRLEQRGWIAGRWRRVAGRERRYYRITAEGRRVLERQRGVWRTFIRALDRVTGLAGR